MQKIITLINILNNNRQTNKIVSLILIIIIYFNTLSFSQLTDVTEQLINTTTFIECINNDNSRKSGTGFFFNFNIDSMFIHVIVTNYHVIENALKNNSKINLYFNEKNILNQKPNYGKVIKYSIPNIIYSKLNHLIIRHPDTNIDLAIIFLGPILKENNNIFYIPYSEKAIPNNEFINNNIYAIEEIFMIGYPKEIFDHVNYIPIVRRGITATPFNMNYNNKNQFLIDISIFPGSSGSPVYLYKNGVLKDKRGNILIGGDSQFSFLGIATGSFEPLAELRPYNLNVNFPINIGLVIKSQEILGFKPLIEKLIKNRP